jgi:hypothetical protein
LNGLLSSTFSSGVDTTGAAFLFFFPPFDFLTGASRASKSGNYSTVFTTWPIGINSFAPPAASSLANESSGLAFATASAGAAVTG